MSSFPTSPRFLLMGQLSRDYFILPHGQVVQDVPGGNLIYAAVGLQLWSPEPAPGLVSRVGEDYPQVWLDKFASFGLDTRGIHVLPEPVDLRNFYVYSDRTTRLAGDPVGHFARLGLPFPKALLGYRPPKSSLDSRTRLNPTSLRQGDIPQDYLMGGAAHLCPARQASPRLRWIHLRAP